MFIKDLELAKDLNHEERAVRGGFGNIALIGGQYANTGGSGVSFASPAVNVGPTVTQTYAPVSVDLDTISLTKNLSAVGSQAFQA